MNYSHGYRHSETDQWENLIRAFRAMTGADQEAFIGQLSRSEQQALMQYVTTEDPRLWSYMVGPQKEAFFSPADVLLFGGAAGGGKTDLAIGLALSSHRRSLIVRREGLQLLPVKDRLTEILGGKEGLNASVGTWKVPPAQCGGIERHIQFGGVPNPGDEIKFQGNPRDLLVLDEAANLLESQVRFLLGWVRTTVPGQRARCLMCSNPPTSAEGMWILDFFAPWLDHQHPNPAEPGELRWFATVEGKDMEMRDERPFVLLDGHPMYDFEDAGLPPTEVIKPQSRSFIPSKIADNPFLFHTGYTRQLQALPEPLRSQMLHGDFLAGLGDDIWQAIPSDWVQAAMNRWEEKVDPGRMDSMGVDVSRGGRDEAVIACRHGSWYARIEAFPGAEVPDGPTLGAHVLRLRRDASPIHVDVVGVGASVYDYLKGQKIQAVGISGAEKVGERDKTGTFSYRNKRSALYWQMREALDPKDNPTLALPPDPALKADLCAPLFKILEGNVLAIESKEDLVKRLGRSPDRGDAVIYASEVTVPEDSTILDYSRVNRSKVSPVQRAMRHYR